MKHKHGYGYMYGNKYWYGTRQTGKTQGMGYNYIYEHTKRSGIWYYYLEMDVLDEILFAFLFAFNK